MTEGHVSFVPEEPATGHPARGSISPDGSFELTTFENNDGAFPGNYNVTVFAYGEPRPVKGGVIPLGVGPLLIPNRYTDATTTDLQVTVEDKPTEVKLELKD